MKKTTLLLRWLPALWLVAFPVAAQASTGPVGRFLQGPTVDPQAQSLIQITAPAGGYVMVHRNNRVVAWIRATQTFSARSGQRFRLAAVKGNTLVSSLTVVARTGQTAVSFPRGVAAVRYLPALTPSQRIAARGRLRAPASYIPGRHFKRLQLRLRQSRSDRQRLGLLRPYASRYRFQGWQIRTVLAEFRQASSRRRAHAWLLSKRKRRTTAAVASRRAHLSKQRGRRASLAKQHRLRIPKRSTMRVAPQRRQGS